MITEISSSTGSSEIPAPSTSSFSSEVSPSIFVSSAAGVDVIGATDGAVTTLAVSSCCRLGLGTTATASSILWTMKGMQSEICLCLLAFTRAISFGSHASTLALAPAMLGVEREFALLRLDADGTGAGDEKVKRFGLTGMVFSLFGVGGVGIENVTSAVLVVVVAVAVVVVIVVDAVVPAVADLAAPVPAAVVFVAAVVAVVDADIVVVAVVVAASISAISASVIS